jgi:hypothetical protein
MSDDRDAAAGDAALEAFARSVDWEAWQAPAPPPGFAQRVVAGLPRERGAPGSSAVPARRQRARRVALVALACALGMALLVGWRALARESTGQHRASTRTEVALGARALAVLEAGAEVLWRGPRVTQRSGAVFYRIEPGSTFRIDTPAGAVEVLGTCFSVAIDAAQPPSVRVDVYEGRVRVLAGAEALELGAGGSAQMDASGVRPVERAALDASELRGAAGAGDAAQGALESLGEEVTRLRAELASLQRSRRALDERVARAERELARAEGTPPPRHPYDLAESDWRELALTGRVKFRLPCARPDFRVSAPLAERLGLAPDDAELIEHTYAASRERVWRVLRPLCVAELGNEALADRIDRQGCEMVILESQQQRDPAAKKAALRQVAEIRAGLRLPPGAGEALHPVAEMLLTLTGEQARFEAELAEALGPEDARRIAFDDEICHERLTLD